MSTRTAVFLSDFAYFVETRQLFVLFLSGNDQGPVGFFEREALGNLAYCMKTIEKFLPEMSPEAQESVMRDFAVVAKERGASHWVRTNWKGCCLLAGRCPVQGCEGSLTRSEANGDLSCSKCGRAIKD